MLGTVQKGRTKIITNHGAVGTSSPGTAVTTAAASTDKGSVAELITSGNNTQDSWGITVVASNYAAAATASQGCMDILIGGATDDILIPNLLMGNCGGPGGAESLGKFWFFPLFIPSGVRIAAQAAGIRTSTAMRVTVFLHGGSPPPFRIGRKVTTYGMGTVPNGTTLTVGASGAAQGITQIVASTTEDHFAFMPSFQVPTDTTVQQAEVLVGIGVGTSTEDIIGQWMYGKSVNETIQGPVPAFPAFCEVPSGTRLVMLASNSNTNDANGYNGVIHAVS